MILLGLNLLLKSLQQWRERDDEQDNKERIEKRGGEGQTGRKRKERSKCSWKIKKTEDEGRTGYGLALVSKVQ